MMSGCEKRKGMTEDIRLRNLGLGGWQTLLSGQARSTTMEDSKGEGGKGRHARRYMWLFAHSDSCECSEL